MKTSDADGLDMLYKRSVSSVYDTEAFRSLLRDVLHPGGLGLTHRVAEIAGAEQGSMVLDIGCGDGAACFLFSSVYGCKATGIDLSERKFVSSRCKAKTEGLSERVCFIVSDTERLPFHAACFDIVVSECAFSILPDKVRAAEEIRRVLKPKGRIVMTDVVCQGGLSRDTGRDDPGGRVMPLIPCLAGAVSLEEYATIFEKAGLRRSVSEDHTVALKEIGYRMALRFGGWRDFLCRLAEQLQSRAPGSDRFGADGCSLDRTRELLSGSKLGYGLIGMVKP
ncbi:MAG: DVU_1556 family methyltransferase [Thermodesulfobacteriota bacterium]